MALQHRLRPRPDGDAGGGRPDGPADQPEGRAAPPGRPEADSKARSAVFEPLYSRSSIMTFSLTDPAAGADPDELAAAARDRRAQSETPRRLRRIVLTLPTGMPLAERLIFRKRAEAARDLVWMMMGWKLDDAAAPARPRADQLGRGELHPRSSISTPRWRAISAATAGASSTSRASRAARPATAPCRSAASTWAAAPPTYTTSTPTGWRAPAPRSRCSPSRSSAKASTWRATIFSCASCRAMSCRRSRRRCARPASPTRPT